MRDLFIKVWNSPTLMTWLSYSSRAITLFAVLPLVLSRFNSGDVLLWYLFSTIISLQGIVDFGFRQTFTRIISYAYSGASFIPDLRVGEVMVEKDSPPNKLLLNRIVYAMKIIYRWLSILLFILLILFGTWALLRPVLETSDPMQSWMGWFIILIITCISFYGKTYLNFIEGLNLIPLARRMEMFFSLGAVVSSVLVMVWFPTLLNLVLANQIWLVVLFAYSRYKCYRAKNGLYREVSVKVNTDNNLIHEIWRPAWRTGVSGLMSTGLTNLTGIIYAQFDNVPAAASYLLALRIINQVKEISMAPFYSKLPYLAMLRVKNEMNTFIQTVRRGMFLSYMVFVIGFILAGLFTQTLLNYIHSEVPFVSNGMWLLLGIAFFLHRYGAMHLQAYLSANHIISHVADGVTGIIFISSTLLLINFWGIYAVPAGMIMGYVLFYCWYSAVHSYRSMKTNFLHFERSTLLLPALLLLLYVLFTLTIETT